MVESKASDWYGLDEKATVHAYVWILVIKPYPPAENHGSGGKAMLVSRDDIGILFFRSLIQYRQFFRQLPSDERLKYHRDSRRCRHLSAIRPINRHASTILLRID